MSIRLILLLTIVGIILITLGLMGLYVDVTRRLHKIEKSLNSTKSEVSHTKSQIRVLEERDKQKSDKLVIEYQPVGSDIKYGGEGI